MPRFRRRYGPDLDLVVERFLPSAPADGIACARGWFVGVRRHAMFYYNDPVIKSKTTSSAYERLAEAPEGVCSRFAWNLKFDFRQVRLHDG
jgi:hypothetical protein